MDDPDASTTTTTKPVSSSTLSISAWEPLEGTPDVFNVLAQRLDFDTRQWQFVDVLGWDDDLLSLTIPIKDSSKHPQPSAKNYRAVALILLFPTTDHDIQTYLSKNSSQTWNVDTTSLKKTPPSDCFFLKQMIGGSCGTLAVVHAMANGCRDAIAPDSALSSMLTAWVDSPDDLAKRSHSFVNSAAVQQAHALAAASSNSTRTTSRMGQRQGRHFLTWVHRNGTLWEVDGRRDAPTPLGTTSDCNFLQDAVVRAKGILAASCNPSIQACCMALVPIVVD